MPQQNTGSQPADASTARRGPPWTRFKKSWIHAPPLRSFPSATPLRPWWRTPAARYSFSVAMVALAALLRVWLVQQFGPSVSPNLTFVPATIVVAAFAGVGPGLLSVLLSSVAADFLYLNPIHTFAIANSAEAVSLGIYATVNVGICVLLEAMRKRRDRIEADLRQRELQLQEVQRIARLGTWELDLATGAVTWTEELYRMFGLDPAQPAPTFDVHRSLFTPESWLEVSAGVERTARDGVPYEFEVEIIRVDGSHGWMLARGEAIRNENSQIVALRGAALDITQRKQAELERQRAEASISALVNSTEDHIWSVDADFRMRTFNRGMKDALERLHGVQLALGMRPEEVLPPDIAALWVKLYQRALAEGPFRTEYSSPSVAGLELSFNPIRENGRNVGVSVFSRDISDRKRAEAELRESEQKYRSVVTAMNEGVVLQDVEGKILACNPSGEKILGILSDELKKQTFLTLADIAIHEDGSPFPGDTHPAMMALQTGRPQSQVCMGIRKSDGPISWILINAEPIFHEGETRPHAVVTTFADITRRKLAEAALQESEDRFRVLANFVPQLVWMCHPEGLNFYFNQRWVDYTGMTLDESYGGGWNEPFHPDDKEAAWHAWESAITTGETYEVESRLRRKDGVYRWFLMRGMPLKDPDGRITRWFGTCTDIHDMKQAQAELRTLNLELEQRVEQRTADLLKAKTFSEHIINNLPGIFYLLDQNGRVLMWNRNNERVTGYSGQELAGMHVENFVPEAERALVRARMTELFQNGAAEVEATLVARDGVRTPYLFTGGRIDVDGRPCLLGFGYDITARKQAEARLRETTSRFQMIMDHAPVAIFVKDRDGRFVFGNRPLERFTGLPLERLLGRTDYDFAPRQDANQWRENDLRVLQGEPAEFEETGVDRDGRPYTNLSVKFPLSDASGTPVEVCGISTDITALKQAENALRASEQKYRNLFESIEEMVVVYRVERDRHGRIVERRLLDANPAFLRAAGAPSLDCLRGKTSSEVFGKDWSDAHLSTVQKAMDTGQVQTQQIYQPRSDRHYVTTVVRLDNDSYLGTGWDITAIKKAEQTLRESEERFRVLTQNLHSGVALVDGSGAIAIVNKAFRRIFDIPEEADIQDVYSTRWAEWLVYDESGRPLDLEEHPVRKAATSLRPVKNHVVAVKSPFSLDLKWLLISAEPVLDEKGILQHLICTYYDITDRKQAEAELQRTRSVLAEGQRIAHLGTFEYIPATQTTLWSEEQFHIFGLDPSGPSPSGPEFFEKCIPAQDRAQVDRVFNTAMDKAATYELEHRILRPDGSVRWVYDRAHPSFDPDGRLDRYIGATLDITDRKQAEEALRESEKSVRRKLEAILSPGADIADLNLSDLLDIPTVEAMLKDHYGRSGISIGVVDLNGKVLAATEFQDICGKFHRVNPQTCRNCVESDTVLASDVQPGEFKRYQCKNNMWDVSTPIVVGGRQLGTVIVGQFFLEGENVDTTLFQAQAERYGFDPAAYMAALERVPRVSQKAVDTSMSFFVKFAEILSQLSYSGIKQARAMTEVARVNTELSAVNKELESFNYAVAHDLRAPLRHIHGFSDLLAEEAAPVLSETARENLAAIQDSVQHMSRLLEDLLSLSRLGRQELRKHLCDFGALVAEAITICEPDLKDRRVEWRIGKLPRVECDPSLMKLVLLNLLANAIKFTRRRECAVIEIGQMPVDVETVIYIRDNGVGFSMKYVEKLFGLFQRLHRQEDFEGTGVGLAIVQRIMHRHGGRAWAEGELNRGATFYLSFKSYDPESLNTPLGTELPAGNPVQGA